MESYHPKNTVGGVLVLFGAFTLLCALMLGAGAGWYGYRRSLESGRWPTATARLSDCRLLTTYDSWRARARALHHVECVFQYEANGAARTTTARVGDTASVVRGQIEITTPAVSRASLARWVNRHPSGTSETIHYDPADPDRISLVGVDDDVATKTPAAYLRAATTFASIGAGLVVAGGFVRRGRDVRAGLFR